ncbi:MAG: hypothetical protein ACRCZD_17830, partial [Phycicoccus sp.]
MSASGHPVQRPAPSLADALRGGSRRGAARPRPRPSTGERWRAALPTRDALVDAAFAAALVAVALVGLRTGFLGDRWVVVAGSGLLLGLLVGHLAAAWRWMAATTLLVLTLVYFL